MTWHDWFSMGGITDIKSSRWLITLPVQPRPFFWRDQDRAIKPQAPWAAKPWWWQGFLRPPHPQFFLPNTTLDPVCLELYFLRSVDTPGNTLSSSHCRHSLSCLLLNPVSAHPTNCSNSAPSQETETDRRGLDGVVLSVALSQQSFNSTRYAPTQSRIPITLVC